MAAINRYTVEPLQMPVNEYRYIVKTLTSIDGGKTFYHCGNSRYFATEAEATAYKAAQEAQEPTPEQAEPAAEETTADGVYYFFDCMNAFLTDRLFMAAAFDGEQEAIKTAANYEATLYRLTYKGGERVESKTIYDPWQCFDN